MSNKVLAEIEEEATSLVIASNPNSDHDTILTYELIRDQAFEAAFAANERLEYLEAYLNIVQYLHISDGLSSLSLTYGLNS